MRFFLLIILFASINAQSIITGRVTDSRTGNPLVGVNIFFSRTTYGSTTDINGFYTLDDIPPGRYELLVSMIGYKLLKESFQIDTDIKIDRDYKLVSQPIRMKEIVVSAKSNREWKKNYKRFKSAFLGMSKYLPNKIEPSFTLSCHSSLLNLIPTYLCVSLGISPNCHALQPLYSGTVYLSV